MRTKKIYKYRLTINDSDGIETISWQELKEKLNKIDFTNLSFFMEGKTQFRDGAYVDDIERFFYKKTHNPLTAEQQLFKMFGFKPKK